MLKRIGQFMFFGLASAYLLVLCLSQWTWLAMRANISLLIPILLFLGAIWALLSKAILPRLYFGLIELLIPLVFLLLYHDLAVLTIMPAIILREAFNLNSLSLWQGNLIILFLLFAANLCWFSPERN